jgi:hypothetical protein
VYNSNTTQDVFYFSTLPPPPNLEYWAMVNISGYAVLVEKVGHFLEKAGLFWKMPGFFPVGQVLVV